MTEDNDKHEHGPPSVSAAAVKRILWFLFAICAVCVLLDLTYDKHGHHWFENIIGFHALYGFLGYVLLVLTAAQLRKIVKRDEDYYDD